MSCNNAPQGGIFSMNKPECFVEYVMGQVLLGINSKDKDAKNFEVAKYVKLAVSSLEKGRLHETITYLESALEICEREDVYNIMGLAYFFMGDDDKSFDCFDKALEINSGYIEAHYNTALLFHRLKMYDRALEIFDEIIDDGGINGSALEGAYNNKACMLIEEDKHDEAIKLLKTVILLNDTCIESLINLGNVYYKLNNFKEAKKYYDKALLVSNQCAPVYIGLGAVAFENGDFKKAGNLFDKSLSINKFSEAAQENKKILSKYN